MFQRLSSFFFGEEEEASAELKGPKPCVTEADEEGWLLVNLPGEDGVEVPSIAQSLPHSECQRVESEHKTYTPSQTCVPTPPPCKSRRTRGGRAQAAFPPSPSSCPSLRPTPPSLSESVGVHVRSSPTHCPRGSVPVSPGSRSDCSSGGLERCSMDESWFITPPPCFTAEGATAETSPMEDLLIEHPSMSVYVSPGNLSMVEESVASLAGSVSKMSDSAAPPVVRSTLPPRIARGAASQAGALVKVTQVSRVQRAKARAERRNLGRKRIQRQNRVREQVPRHVAHARNSFLHQPCQRSFCH
ncbi:tumor protein p53-inducible nuclear protein 2 isoform X2 [Chanos chanos]|uniref:Tumor protein p53-inducible nuclear protein 2 isoform X2 n=1 Tax=Chanos chanos TaxID=29144 RepID=A0A6J2UTA4_CHACN|nr:tumor protein p53-inducible nuclear protein 2 isoform X2 [Chanos chanos]